MKQKNINKGLIESFLFLGPLYYPCWMIKMQTKKEDHFELKGIWGVSAENWQVVLKLMVD